MNLKTWFKGLGVFVVSSFITSLAAANLSPSTFNFSKAGAAKLGALALIIGAKAVLLYLKQSPLSPPGGTTNWTKIGSAVALAAVLPGALVTSGCVSSWEQTTYATLATGKALIDCAVAGYNHFDADIRHACAANPGDPAFDPTQFYIPQTRDAQQAIEKARQVQIACVEAFEGYAIAKVGKDKTVPLADKQAVIVSYLAQLPALLNAVRSLIGKPAPKGAARPSAWSDPIAAIAALRPAAADFRSSDLSPSPRSPDHPMTAITRFFPEVSLGQ